MTLLLAHDERHELALARRRHDSGHDVLAATAQRDPVTGRPHRRVERAIAEMATVDRLEPMRRSHRLAAAGPQLEHVLVQLVDGLPDPDLLVKDPREQHSHDHRVGLTDDRRVLRSHAPRECDLVGGPLPCIPLRHGPESTP